MLELSTRYPERRAFITGAASGLGRALCRQLAVEGWTLGMADVDENGLMDAADEIRATGGTPEPVVLDVTDAEAFSGAADAFVDAVGGVDFVVNNAGIGAGGPFEEMSLDDWDTVLNVNLRGVIYGCRAFVPHLTEHGGHLMNVASLAAVAAGPFMSAYNVTKAGVRALSETLYAEYRSAGVHVSVLMPPFFKTNIDADQRGPASMQQMTRKLMEKSGVTADQMAQHALQEVGKDRIHILYTDWQSRIVWYWKRLSPGTYVKYLPKRADEIRKAVRKMDVPAE